MHAHDGLYSVVQYHLDPWRYEGINIGIVLVCPELHVLEVQWAPNNERVKRIWGKEFVDEFQLNFAKSSFENRIRMIALTEEDFRTFLGREAGHVRGTAPLPVFIDSIEQSMARLYADFVEDKYKRSSLQKRNDSKESQVEVAHRIRSRFDDKTMPLVDATFEAA